MVSGCRGEVAVRNVKSLEHALGLLAAEEFHVMILGPELTDAWPTAAYERLSGGSWLAPGLRSFPIARPMPSCIFCECSPSRSAGRDRRASAAAGDHRSPPRRSRSRRSGRSHERLGRGPAAELATAGIQVTPEVGLELAQRLVARLPT
jgi:hypothetical protein